MDGRGTSRYRALALYSAATILGLGQAAVASSALGGGRVHEAAAFPALALPSVPGAQAGVPGHPGIGPRPAGLAGASTSAVVDPATQTVGTTYYVDCGASGGGDGSVGHPFGTLSAVDALTLGAGDQVLFAAGSSCDGMIEPHGNGAIGHPIVFGSYGQGSSPTIDGRGSTIAAVHLANMSHVVVQDLALTDPYDPAYPTSDVAGVHMTPQAGNDQHNGVYLSADGTAPGGQVTDITLQRLYVHNTGGEGIYAVVTGSTAGHFDRVTIQDDTVRYVLGTQLDSGAGIRFIGTVSSSQPPPPGQVWPEGATNIVARRNHVSNTDAQAIVLKGTDGGIITDNVAAFGDLAGYSPQDPVNRRSAAGIWVRGRGGVVEYNEVHHMNHGATTTQGGAGGYAFDIDVNSDDIVVQYNYSHDNAGGFTLICTEDLPHRGDFRYNLSVDDAYVFDAGPCGGSMTPGPTSVSTGVGLPIGGDAGLQSLDGIRMYNNTFVENDPATSIEGNEAESNLVDLFAGSFLFANNIVYAYGRYAQDHTFVCGNNCSHNLFYNMPVPATATNSVTRDPLFADPTARAYGLGAADTFRLLAGSPAVAAGTQIGAGSGGYPAAPTADFFGNPIPASPAIGFYQGPPVIQ